MAKCALELFSVDYDKELHRKGIFQKTSYVRLTLSYALYLYLRSFLVVLCTAVQFAESIVKSFGGKEKKKLYNT